jgi:succinyl-diaminopimelate desuccinylase
MLIMDVTNFKDEIISALKGLIEIKSVRSKAKPDMPFGEGVSEALSYMLSLARDMGFRVVDVDGYAGRIEFGGETAGEVVSGAGGGVSGKRGEKIGGNDENGVNNCADEVGILCHLDVVPAGEGWNTPPFKATVSDGKIFGRGAIDDKGPAVSVLYALKALKDGGFKPSKRAVIILGCDEESDWQCMDYYRKKYRMPKIGFTPDAEFPLINCEKGVLHLQIKSTLKPCSDIKILGLSGGDRINVVPDRAEARVAVNGKKISLDALKKAAKNHGVSVAGCTQKPSSDTYTVTLASEGIRAHGSTPGLGKNALWGLLRLLNELYTRRAVPERDDAGRGALAGGALDKAVSALCFDTVGRGLNAELSDDVSGALSCNLGTARISGSGVLSLGVDIRYPATKKREEIEARIKKKLGGDFYFSEIKNHPSLYVAEDEPLIKTLLKAYEKITGDKGRCLAIGGGTYAKALPTGVAFGPMLPGQGSVVHAADEYIGIDHLMLISRIYYEAIKELCGNANALSN